MWKQLIVSGVLLQARTLTDGQIQTKADPPLALQCASYKYTVGTHPGSSHCVVYQQQCCSASAPASTS